MAMVHAVASTPFVVDTKCQIYGQKRMTFDVSTEFSAFNLTMLLLEVILP